MEKVYHILTYSVNYWYFCISNLFLRIYYH